MKDPRIIRGEPIPPPRRMAYPRDKVYPLMDKLEVGESWIEPVPEGETAKRVQARLSNAAYSRMRRDDRQFTTRQLADGSGVQVWRIR